MSRKMVRREFLGQVSRATVGAMGTGLLSETARAATPRIDQNSKIGFGLIGCGSLGRNHHLSSILRRDDLDVIAVCDVDQKHLGEAIEMTEGKAQGYADFRHLLDRKDIDAVMVVTPDHWHSLASIDACMAGKDVYCEKPLSLTIAEGRAMVDAARRYGRVFQTGSQQRSSYNFRWACDLVQNGAIGTLKNIRTVLGQGPTCDYEPDTKPPAHLDWDAWLGPAPFVPYTPKRCHYTFRWFFDYSGGKMTDWGAHHLDIAQWGHGSSLGGPTKVEATAVPPATGLFETPVDFEVKYTYSDGVTIQCVGEGENGITFEGTDGTIFVSRGRIGADPIEILDTPPDSGEIGLYLSEDHRSNWIECMRTREKPICDVEIGHRSATVCHLGNMAIKLGRPLQWDPEQERFIDDDEANRLVMKPMRLPYSL